MKKQVRYELLREAKVPRNFPIHSRRVARVVADSLRKAPAIATSNSSFLIPWNEFHTFDDITISWGLSNSYPCGGEQLMYYVERKRVEPWYQLRAIQLDTDGMHVHSDYVLLGSNLTMSEALLKRKSLDQAWKKKGWFFDIYPQDL